MYPLDLYGVGVVVMLTCWCGCQVVRRQDTANLEIIPSSVNIDTST